LLWVLVLTASSYGQELAGENQLSSDTPSASDKPVQLSRQQTVAPLPSQALDATTKRDQKLRMLTGMLLLILILVAFFLMLMVLVARWTRFRFAQRKRRKPTPLEDLWFKVKDEALPEVDIEDMMSEDEGEQKEQPDAEVEEDQDG